MAPKEKRKEIYDFVHQIKEGNIKEWQKDLSKLLKEYGRLFGDPVESHKKKTAKKNPIKKTISPQQQKERDIKNGIWKPDEHYGL